MFETPIRGSRGGRGLRRGARGSSRSSRGRIYGPSSIETFPTPPCGELLQSLTLDEISNSVDQKTPDARISDCNFVASYNWVDKAQPSIVVPGLPPKWTPLSRPPKLQQDAGTYYRDLNASRYPHHPMEPAVEAIMKMKAESMDDASSGSMKIDIVACGSTLGNLLRFARGDGKSFRMLVEVVGQTVHLIRRENSPMETIEDIKGFGHTFPEAYTTWDRSVQGSSSHQRIIRYRFGGLDCLLRFEGDGYLPDKAKSSEINVTTRGEASDTSLDDLAQQLGGSKVSPAALSQDGKGLDMSSAGSAIPQDAVFDLKTRSIKWKLEEQEIIEAELPRLWVRQIPNLILAYHVSEKVAGGFSGRFTDIETHDIRERIEEWESKEGHHLKRFAALLKRIVNIAKAKAGGRLELVRLAEEDSIQVREQLEDVGRAFSPGTNQRWTRWLNKGT